MKAVFILGPTGAGKSSLALELASSGRFAGIINADASQAYRQLSVGAAKPTLEERNRVPHYLFDVADCIPRSFDASQYRAMVEGLPDNVVRDGDRPPLIVGGSLFYSKSLFFKLREAELSGAGLIIPREPGVGDWEYLKIIDPVRAEQIHPHDAYRVRRALDLYLSTGTLPSACAPVYDPVFPRCLVVWVSLPDDILRSRIAQRVRAMLDGGWAEEVEGLVGTPWEDFAREGYALGYDDVYQWLMRGSRADERENLVAILINKTWQYARRQRIFWASFKKALEGRPGIEIVEAGPDVAALMVFERACG